MKDIWKYLWFIRKKPINVLKTYLQIVVGDLILIDVSNLQAYLWLS